MIIIRPIKKSDINQIAQIETESFSDPFPIYFFQYLAENVSDLFFVAIENNVVIGYVVADIEKYKGFNRGHLLSLAIKSDKRRKGVGRQLFTVLMEVLRERHCREVLLEVRVSNYSAKMFYQKLGFQMIKRSSKYYKDGEDALVMVLNLEERS